MHPVETGPAAHTRLAFPNTYHHADCLDLMRRLPDGSVDFICTDPPYHTTRLAFDEGPRIDWAAWWREANRILTPAGIVCLFASGTFTFALHATNPKAWRYTLIWHKSRWTRYLSANHRPLQAHEDILVFCRQPRQATYHPQKTGRKIKIPRITRSAARRGTHYGRFGANIYRDDGLRHPGTVLQFASGDRKHNLNPTQKPVELLRWLVRSYSNPGDIVLDTCAGSGTTAIACLDEGRTFICCDTDPDQCQKATQRIANHIAQQPLRLEMPKPTTGSTDEQGGIPPA